jgi:hypothetical protein
LPKKFEKFEEDKFSELHRLIIVQRNKHVAHSDKSEREVVVFNDETRVSINLEPSVGHGFAVDYSNLNLSIIKNMQMMCEIQIKRLFADIGTEIDLIMEQNKIVGLHELISLKKYKKEYLD